MYVPAYNAERTLERCLESVRSQTTAVDEVFVIDDGSTDRTAEIARAFGASVIRNGSNRGVAYCRNLAMNQARNPLVASVDSDCVLDPRWLEILLPHMDSPTIACVGGALREAYVTSLADRWRSEHLPQHWGPHPLVNPQFLFGCNTLCRREAVLSVGGYDNSLTTNGEDVDISRRMTEAGWNLVYDPGARAYHLQRDTARSVLARWWRWHNPRPAQQSAKDMARRLPRYLFHGARYALRDLARCPQLVPLDAALPFAQLYFDVLADRPIQRSKREILWRAEGG